MSAIGSITWVEVLFPPSSSSEIEGKIRSALSKATPDDIKDDASIDVFIGGMEKVEKGCNGVTQLVYNYGW